MTDLLRTSSRFDNSPATRSTVQALPDTRRFGTAIPRAVGSFHRCLLFDSTGRPLHSAVPGTVDPPAFGLSAMERQMFLVFRLHWPIEATQPMTPTLSV